MKNESSTDVTSSSSGVGASGSGSGSTGTTTRLHSSSIGASGGVSGMSPTGGSGSYGSSSNRSSSTNNLNNNNNNRGGGVGGGATADDADTARNSSDDLCNNPISATITAKPSIATERLRLLNEESCYTRRNSINRQLFYTKPVTAEKPEPVSLKTLF